MRRPELRLNFVDTGKPENLPPMTIQAQ